MKRQYLIILFAINRDLSKADNPEKYKEIIPGPIVQIVSLIIAIAMLVYKIKLAYQIGNLSQFSDEGNHLNAIKVDLLHI